MIITTITLCDGSLTVIDVLELIGFPITSSEMVEFQTH